jgi:pilus assembly protein CpaB
VNRKRFGILMVVLGALIAIGVGAFVYLQVQEAAEIAKRIPTVDVVVASVDLPARAAIPLAAVQVVKMPAELVPMEAATKVQSVAGKYPLQKIYKSEVVIQSKLADSTGRTGPSFTLKEGMVAIAFQGNDALTAAGALREGDMVDLLITLPLARPVSGEQAGVSMPNVSQTMLQSLEVLRVGLFPAPGATDSGGGGARTVTFQVSHQDALILKWAKDSGGTMDLILRHPADNEAVVTDPITAAYVFKKYRFTLAEPLQ